MRLTAGLLGGFLVAAAAPAVAQAIDPITLKPGEAVTVRLDDGGRATSPERRSAEWSAMDAYAAHHLSGITPPDAPVSTAVPFSSGYDGPKPEPIPPGEMRMRFLSIAGRHSLLVVENGLPHAIRYRARMIVDGKTRATDVCVVLAGYPSYEHWPHPIERIELSDFRPAAMQPGQPPTCE